MTEAQTKKLFGTFIQAIMERCAAELGITLDALVEAYCTNNDVRETMNDIFDRHIKALGKN